MATGKDWDRLAEHVRERRAELGITQEDVRAAGGPSTATMRLIEGALQQNYQPSILARLERALQWQSRSVQRILGGGEPVPLEGETAPQPVPFRRPAGNGTAPLTLEEGISADLLGSLIKTRIADLAEHGPAIPDGETLFIGDDGDPFELGDPIAYGLGTAWNRVKAQVDRGTLELDEGVRLIAGTWARMAGWRARKSAGNSSQSGA